MKSTVRNYLSLVKFSHTIFAMPFALISTLIVIGMAIRRTMPQPSPHIALQHG